MKHEGFPSQSIRCLSLFLSLSLSRARADEVTLLLFDYYFLDLLSVNLDTRDLSRVRIFTHFKHYFLHCAADCTRELIINNRRDKKP